MSAMLIHESRILQGGEADAQLTQTMRSFMSTGSKSAKPHLLRPEVSPPTA